MTTPIDEEAEIRRLERETEGLKMLTAQQDAKNEVKVLAKQSSEVREQRLMAEAESF